MLFFCLLLCQSRNKSDWEILERFVWLLSVTVSQKEDRGKKLITTWEGRELVTWLFLTNLSPFVSPYPQKQKTRKQRKILLQKKREIIYISEISSRLFTVFTTHKFLSFVIKTGAVRADSKCSQLKETIKFWRHPYHLSRRQKFEDDFKDSFELPPLWI